MKAISLFFGLLTLFAATITLPGTARAAALDIAQRPLYMGGGGIPGNLVLVPSVEWPTINGVANLDNVYSPSKVFVGYFDSNKCYAYSHNSTESLRHFYPTGTTTTRTCSGAWSGNFLNWATTQTIDPFRKALTGGYRVRDTSTETWLEKARHDGQGGTGIYPNRRLPDSGTDSTLVSGATPVSWSSFQMRIQGLGNKMYLTRDGDVNSPATLAAYNPASAVDNTTVYEVSIRVKVCDTTIGVEANCRQYSLAWKPEGTIQQYAGKLRYSVFGYLNHSITQRDGGVLRAKAKYVGPTMPSTTGEVTNPNREWDGTTGVLIANPDSADATATSTAYSITVSNSGVINYLNKFGQMTTQNHKSYDPVSELYYAAIRYLKNQGNVPEYSDMSGTATEKYNLADGFPVITSWTDPVTNWCQPNVILGIGDVYTHRDKNLPGNTVATDEPTTPASVTADTSVNVNTATQKVAQLEGVTINTPFTGRENSAYMAGLAYDAHTNDIRPDLTGGKTTISTYWVDVCEAQSLEPIHRNQFYLTAKYGGFDVPEDFDPYTHSTALPTAWWHTNTDTLTSFGSRGDGSTFPRPDNYFIASEASAMVQSLTQAFADITTRRISSAAAIATNSTRLDTGTFIYQARFNSADWAGQLLAYKVNSDGSIGTVQWEASEHIPTHNLREIFTHNGTNGVELTWANLTAAQQTALGSAQVLSYLRGDHSLEQRNGGTLRNRSSRLGDVVNSDPWYVGTGNFGYNVLPDPEGDAYVAFRSTTAYRDRTPMLYVGANDGMLHAFNADTGAEHFAYMPRGVINSNLATLTDPRYTHRYFVDGPARAGDAYITRGGTLKWATVLVGSTGAGGRSVFALDVTTPGSFGASNVIWEFGYNGATNCTAGVTACKEIGTTIGQPSIVRMRNGKWAAIFGNGYNSDSGTAQLFIVNLETGALIKAIDTGVGNTTTPNGLATPLVVDVDQDSMADYVYAGDLYGNMWKFDITSTHATNFNALDVDYKLHQALDVDGNPQPITAKPAAGRHPESGLMIYFGTGKYFEAGDNLVDPVQANRQVHSFYGLRDNGSLIGARTTNLLEQEILYEDVISFTNPDTSEVIPHGIRVVSETAIGSLMGWYIDLISPAPANGGRQGERVISTPLVWRDRVIFVTIIPDPDPCSFGGTSWMMEVDPLDGGRLDFSPFDLNKDGLFDTGDYIELTLPDGTKVKVPVSGRRSEEGLIKTPGVISADDAAYKYASGSSGQIEVVKNKAPGGAGRQSWQQLR